MNKNGPRYNWVYVYAKPDYDYCLLSFPLEGALAQNPPLYLGHKDEYIFLGTMAAVARAAVNNSGLSHRAFCRAIGVSTGWVSNVINERHCYNELPGLHYNVMRRMLKFAMNPNTNLSVRISLEED